jgi:hypothetical protein
LIEVFRKLIDIQNYGPQGSILGAFYNAAKMISSIEVPIIGAENSKVGTSRNFTTCPTKKLYDLSDLDDYL